MPIGIIFQPTYKAAGPAGPVVYNYAPTSDNDTQIMDLEDGVFVSMRATTSAAGIYGVEVPPSYMGLGIFSFGGLAQIGSLQAALLTIRTGDYVAPFFTGPIFVRAHEILSPLRPDLIVTSLISDVAFTAASVSFTFAANTTVSLNVKPLLDELIASVGVVGLSRINFKIQPPTGFTSLAYAGGLFPASDATFRPTLDLTY